MDAATVRARLQAEGIAVTAHRDGTLTADLIKPREQSWGRWLREHVAALPGAVVVAPVRERPAGDPWLQHTEVRFRLGGMVGFGDGSTA